jgi:hypothetical protein
LGKKIIFRKIKTAFSDTEQIFLQVNIRNILITLIQLSNV